MYSLLSIYRDSVLLLLLSYTLYIQKWDQATVNCLITCVLQWWAEKHSSILYSWVPTWNPHESYTSILYIAKHEYIDSCITIYISLISIYTISTITVCKKTVKDSGIVFIHPKYIHMNLLVAKLMFILHLHSGFIVATDDVDGRTIYSIPSKDIEYAYKSEIIDYMQTGVFIYDETLDDPVK